MDNLDRLLEILCSERGEAPPRGTTREQKELYFRALCNERPPQPVSHEFLRLQDAFLAEKLTEKGVVHAADFSYADNVCLWRGDITRLDADVIVNAANDRLLGCFVPLHNCIDNAIHSAAGVQMRLECDRSMRGKRLAVGGVLETGAYNLPCKRVFHTVGCIVHGEVTAENRADLAKCYSSCLNKAVEIGAKSIALCCISTGVFAFPSKEACAVAVRTVRQRLSRADAADLKVIFNVFTKRDEELYERELFGQSGAR